MSENFSVSVIIVSSKLHRPHNDVFEAYEADREASREDEQVS